MHGKLLSESKRNVSLNAHDLILLDKINIPGNANEIFFLKLILTDNSKKLLDENLYWLSSKPGSYEKLNELGSVSVKAGISKSDDKHAIISVSNPGIETAFFIRLKITDLKNELVLPSYFTDNYFTLLPGDEKQVGLDFNSEEINMGNHNDLKLVVEGWNILPVEKKF
jgi:hypothetical protein